MLKKRVNIAKKEKRIGDTRWGDRDSRQETKRLAASLAGWLLGFSRSRTRGLGSWGEGRQAIAEAESRTLDRRYRITDGIEGSQAGWSAAMADGLQLLGLNPLRGTIDGAPKFWGPSEVGPLALGQNRACVVVCVLLSLPHSSDVQG